METDMSRLFRTGATLAAAIAATVVGTQLAGAEDKYPSRPVKIVMPLPAGTSPDVRARIVADQLTKAWGQQVVVENRPGAGGAIALRGMLSAPADGYTLMAAPAMIYTILPTQADKTGLDVNRDLIPIGTIAYEGMVIAVSPKLGVNSLAELVARAQKDPYKIALGTLPPGTLPNLAAQLFIERSKAPITIVPYATGGTNAAVTDLLGERIQVVVVSLAAHKGFFDSGDLKALAIMTGERPPSAPDMPTAAETFPGLTAIGWSVLAAPKGTPDNVVRQLNEDLGKVLQIPDIRATLEQADLIFRPMFSTELARFIEAEQALWWPVVKAAAAPK
jgi:tripartite-type tricarboxylate transporter receptor subunit TctC